MSQDVASFRVLHAESAFVDGSKLTALHELHDRNTVFSNGLLILAHRTGKFIAFEGDTLVNIKEMNQGILQSLSMSSCDNDWSDFGMLLSESVRLKWAGPVNVEIPAIEWIIPAGQTLAHPRQEVALLWEPVDESVQEFELLFTTIFDEPIGEPHKLTSNRLVLSMDTFKVDEELPYLLFDVRERNVKYTHSSQLGIKFSETSYVLPDSFVATSAIKALEIAFYLELNDGVEYAEHYYERAVDLSDQLFYQRMLEAFKIRQAR